MSLKDDVKKYLSQNKNKYISGEELAERFGKSRAAVWKAIKALQNEGYQIDAITNKGYKFDEDNDVLSKSEIEASLGFPCKVFCYDSIDSTNTQAKRLLNDGENDVLLITSEEQTAGRGRQGKSFYSPAKTGIYMTLVLHPMTSLQNAVTATTAASVAVCKALEKLTDCKPEIKWVNDIYIDGKKVCGILTEAITDFESQTVESVIIGIGLNISTIEFPSDVENAASLNIKINRARLIGQIANELYTISKAGADSFIDYYKSKSLIIGKEIVFFQNGDAQNATALDIDDEGGLVIRLENGERKTLKSGEISIRQK